MAGYSAKITDINVDQMMPNLVSFIKKGVEKYGAVQVDLTRVNRSIAQNSLFHAQIAEIAKQTKFNGTELTADGAKEYLVLLFAFELEQEQRPLSQGLQYIPSRKTEGGWMPVPPKTSRFKIEEGTEFIDWLFAYGAERNVRFNDDVARQYEAYLAMIDG